MSYNPQVKNPNPFTKAPANHIYSYEKTSMVRIPTKTRDALKELSKARGLEESLGQLITILQRQATQALQPEPISEETIKAVLAHIEGNSNA